MKQKPCLRRFAGAVAISLSLALAATAAAQANSIVYLKSGTSGSRTPTPASSTR